MSVENRRGEGVRSRAPLRLGFAGGGTDLAPYCDQHGGYVMNATVSLYAYAHMKPNPDGRILFDAAEQGVKFDTELAAQVPLDPGTLLHCGVYNRIIAQFNGGRPLAVTIRTTVDVPSGSGMGGSSALVVALIEAFRTYLNLPLGEYDVARLAYEIEREDLKISGGKQDQYAASFGGFNFMEFYDASRVIINPLRLQPNMIRELEASLVLYYTGRSRSSATVIETQQTRMRDKDERSLEAMHALKREAVEMKEALLTGRLQSVASTMMRGWLAKKSTSDAVSNSEIERVLDLALANGGMAGKVSGAGGGGFLLLLASPWERHRVVDVLSREPGRILPAVFTQEGAVSWRTHD
jgi:D-glycero-alpha-D-manno-heptose-7-phosphate kinase